MDVHLFLRLALCSALAVGTACSDESLPQRPSHEDNDDKDDERSSDDDDEEDDDSSEEEDDGDSRSNRRDAGKDAGRDAGKDAGRDAGKRDAEVDDEPGDDEMDAGPRRDAGPSVNTPARDAGPRTTPAEPDTQTPADDPTAEPEPPPGDDAPADRCASLTFQSVSGIFTTYCGNCHGARAQLGDARFDSLDGAKAKSDSIARRVSSKEMPPPTSRQPTADEAQQLLDWVECGAN